MDGSGEFHHTDKKAIYTDPEGTLDIDKGIIINKKTHKKVHNKKINDKITLENKKDEIKKELEEEKDNDSTKTKILPKTSIK